MEVGVFCSTLRVLSFMILVLKLEVAELKGITRVWSLKFTDKS